MCNNNSWGGSNCYWIIIAIIILFLFCGNGSSCGCGGSVVQNSGCGGCGGCC